MTIAVTDLKFVKSQVITDTGINGGRCGSQIVTSGINAVFPNVQNSERLAGSTKNRKLFARNFNAVNEQAYNAKVFLDKFTSEGDIIYIFSGGFTQADLTGNERKYGSAPLSNGDIVAGANSATVQMEDTANQDVFQVGDSVIITDKPTMTDPTGNYQVLTITGVTYDDQGPGAHTLTFAEQIANAYSMADTRIASLLTVGDLTAQSSNIVVSSGSGTFDSVNHPPALDNLGSIDQVWTLTFTSASAFDVTGDDKGAVGSGNINAGVTITNPLGGNYFSISSAAFGGTFAAGDTITFETTVAGKPFWIQRIVPTGMAAPSANSKYSLSVLIETS